MTGSSKDFNLYEKLKLYPEIVLDESVENRKNDLQALISKIESPGANDNVGLLLEDFTKIFLSSPYLIYSASRRRSPSSEIDLDFNVRKFEATLFAEFSFLLLVECKNWSIKIEAKHVRDFQVKMSDSDVRVGIYVSKLGLTRGAKRAIENLWLQERRVILSLSLKDCKDVVDKSINLYGLLVRKYNAVVTSSNE